MDLGKEKFMTEKIDRRIPLDQVIRFDDKAKEILDVLERYPNRRDKEIILRNCLSAFSKNEVFRSQGKPEFDYPADPEQWL